MSMSAEQGNKCEHDLSAAPDAGKQIAFTKPWQMKGHNVLQM
jgi:hypothetical protein